MWSDAAREAAAAARASRGGGKPQSQRPASGVGVRHLSPGASAAFKMRHDLGKDDRIRAYNAAHQQGIVSRVPGWAANIGKAALGFAIGAGSAVVSSAIRSGMRGGHGRR